LLRASDFNQKLREHGCGLEASVQRICRACRDEDEVRGLLEELWKIPSNGEKLLADAVEKNRDVYDFEAKLQTQL
jgi:hypothetical protein